MRHLGRVTAAAFAFAVAPCFMAIPSPVFATPIFHAVYETDPGNPANAVALASYDSLADLLALNESSITPLSFDPTVSMSGLAYDGSQFHAVYETDPGNPANAVALASYDSLADLLAMSRPSRL
jgi:hypothetical protein